MVYLSSAMERISSPVGYADTRERTVCSESCVDCEQDETLVLTVDLR